ncbi:uncharacterized protein LOC107627250 [Arachis ipaensis]|uniref:uncharacterized protein LOC107627250 n=1 Tax=Arachis ipaensis TaxID=130454 RepID=UPI0007AFDEC2|nr:uncharacterized protein LOC107627250 [Arachis ipaensis]XP_025635950.1 uncharacterized protein LOC112730050 [Arachis hypogaea]
MTAVAPLEIRIFSELVNKARVVEEYAKKVASARDTCGENNNHEYGKYFQPRAQHFKRGGHVSQGQGNTRIPTFDQYHYARGRGNQSKTSPDLTCDRCERFHLNDSCKLGIGGCFNCGLPSYMARDCTRGRNPNAGRNQHQGRVFAVNTNDAAKRDPLMRGKYLVGDKTLVALYDIGASHYFIAFDKVEDLGLKMSELTFDLHVHTPYQTVVTKSSCRELAFKIEDREFVHDLICLPMVGLEMILEFDWLTKIRVLLDCFERSIRFLPKGEGEVVVAEGYYLNSVLVNFSREECQGYILLAANALGDKWRLDQISVVRKFSEVFWCTKL